MSSAGSRTGTYLPLLASACWSLLRCMEAIPALMCDEQSQAVLGRDCRVKLADRHGRLDSDLLRERPPRIAAPSVPARKHRRPGCCRTRRVRHGVGRVTAGGCPIRG